MRVCLCKKLNKYVRVEIRRWKILDPNTFTLKGCRLMPNRGSNRRPTTMASTGDECTVHRETKMSGGFLPSTKMMQSLCVFFCSSCWQAGGMEEQTSCAQQEEAGSMRVVSSPVTEPAGLVWWGLMHKNLRKNGIKSFVVSGLANAPEISLNIEANCCAVATVCSSKCTFPPAIASVTELPMSCF